MKGDRGREIACPLLCGVVIPAYRKIQSRNISERQLVRQGMREHLRSQHWHLTIRQASLLLDQVCERLGL